MFEGVVEMCVGSMWKIQHNADATYSCFDTHTYKSESRYKDSNPPYACASFRAAQVFGGCEKHATTATFLGNFHAKSLC